MADGAAKNERFGDIFHFDGRLHARFNVHLVERAAQRQRVDHSGEHAHVIGRGTIHAPMGRRETAPDISPADHHGHLHAEIAHLFDAFANLTIRL